MIEIRKLKVEEIPAFIDIVTNAYTGFMENTYEAKERLISIYTDTQEKNDSIDLYGAFRDRTLLGGMRLHSFDVNFHSKTLKAGGVGLVAVDLLHKKEKVAKELITYFINKFKEDNVPLLMLYPFRPDFYLKMGFGFGTKMNQYHILPSSLPGHGDKGQIRFLTSEDGEQLLTCFNKFAAKQHGMIYKKEFELKRLFNDPNKRIVAFEKEGVLDSYVSFTFKKMSESNFCLNNLVIDELIYNSQEGFSSLCAFLNSQGDQINRIVLNTQDEFFYHVLADPRNHTNEMIPSVYHESTTSGVGIMYRVNDIKQLFQALEDKFVGKLTSKIKISVVDSFLSEQNDLFLHVKNGYVSVCDENSYDVQLTIDLASLSALMMGSVDFTSLYRFGKVTLSSDQYENVLSQLFKTETKPVCMTLF